MNFLAHTLLADQHHDVGRIGGILGDLLKSSDGLPATVAREMRLHRAIDAYTDAHPIVLSSKALFRRHTRRFAGILLDVYYDYCLAADWSRYSNKPMQQLIEQTHTDLLQFVDDYPPSVATIVQRLVDHRLLESYQHLEGIERAIIRTAGRLSRGAELLIEGLDDLRLNANAIRAGFTEFFPELLAFAQERRALLIQDATRQLGGEMRQGAVDTC